MKRRRSDPFRCRCGSYANACASRCICNISKRHISFGDQGHKAAVGDGVGSGPNGVTSPETDPLGDRAVLLLGFGKLLLGTEGFVAL